MIGNKSKISKKSKCERTLLSKKDNLNNLIQSIIYNEFYQFVAKDIKMLEIGQKAPLFSLPNQDGVEISLKVFKGKWLVLYFYPKDNTQGCTNEACDFTEQVPNFEDLNAVIVGVSPDTQESHLRFIDGKKLNITLLSDTDKKALKSYGAWGVKKNYGKEYEGVIRTTYIISPEQKIAAVWSGVKVYIKRKDGVVRHVDIVKDKLKSLQN